MINISPIASKFNTEKWRVGQVLKTLNLGSPGVKSTTGSNQLHVGNENLILNRCRQRLLMMHAHIQYLINLQVTLIIVWFPTYRISIVYLDCNCHFDQI